MLRFFVRRALLAVLTLFAISVTTFALFFAGPSDPASNMCGTKVCSQQQHDRIEQVLGLNEPITTQYVKYMKGIFVGRTVGSGDLVIKCPAPCLGVSFRTREPVLDIIQRGLPITVSIVVGGLLVSWSIGVTLGIIAAIRRGTAFDKVASGGALVFGSLNTFSLGLILLIGVVYSSHLLPRPVYVSPADNPWKWFVGMLLPWLTYGLISCATYARFGRTQMLETLSEDYIRTARAKGLSNRSVNVRHAFRAAMTPLMTLGGLEFGAVLGGVPITETVFNMLGVGRTSVKAIFDANLPIVMAMVLLAGTFVVVMNVIVDMLYAVVDPRVRLN